MTQFTAGEMIYQSSVCGLNCIAGSHISMDLKSNQTGSESINHYFNDFEDIYSVNRTNPLIIYCN